MIFREVEVCKHDGTVLTDEYLALSEAAMKFDCEINIESRQRTANVKSIMGVLSLQLRHGDKVVIVTKGDDEREALEKMCEMLHGGFKE